MSDEKKIAECKIPATSPYDDPSLLLWVHHRATERDAIIRVHHPRGSVDLRWGDAMYYDYENERAVLVTSDRPDGLFNILTHLSSEKQGV